MSVKSAMVKRNEKPPTLVEKIDDGLYKDKSFNWFKDKLKKDFRNSFSHFSYGGEETELSPDNMDNIYLAFEMLPTAHYISRKIIDNLLTKKNNLPITKYNFS